MKVLRDIGEWLLFIAALILPTFVVVGVIMLLNRIDRDDDDWNLF